jgi:hypothetical protein
MQPLIIGITGVARSGKDTVADLLQFALNNKLGHAKQKMSRYSFATPIKEMLRAGLGLGDKDEAASVLFGRSYRYLAQTLGTEWGRNMVGNSIWVDIAERRLQNQLTIISDVRFEDEAALCRKHGLLIHVRRANLKTDLSSSEQLHISESGVRQEPEDYVMSNPGTCLTELAKKIEDQLVPHVLMLKPTH